MTDWKRVTLEFTAGSRSIRPPEELSLAEILLANRLPPTMFQAYEARSQSDLAAIPMTTLLANIPDEHHVVLRCIRNTDIDTLRSADIEVIQRDQAPVAGLLDIEYGRREPLSRVHLVDDDTLREMVSDQIVTFLQKHEVTTSIMAGISGGGDSNTLVYGLTKAVRASVLPAEGVTCFTLAMEPLWPESAVDRARELCDRAGFQHRVLYADDMTNLLGMSRSPAELWESFRRDYGPDTVHFFGTCFVNLIGRRLCRELGGHNLAVGYNREDLLAELLFCLMNGRKPLPYPVRRMGDVNCVFPLWEIPKHLLDACYPRYSASNYRERVDSTTPQRSAIYFLAHCLDALGPEIGLSLMKGVRGLMDEIGGWEELAPVDGTPLMRTGMSDAGTEQQVLGLLREFFPEWSPTA
ncbi:hypothetical protein AB5J62_33405 [Amycolatopsis sp. cg5]|uniref:hypothetical protein n=1 Tax=Amycolatopsis sp. cg5 TaxID=3238802 RepID=UPI0035250552